MKKTKLKMPEQLIYASDEIGQVIERIAGEQLVTVNPTRGTIKLLLQFKIYHN